MGPPVDWALMQQSFPVLVAGGTGLLLAGITLEHVELWNVFMDRPLLFVLMPMLMGLKCNLEMTLASRLATAYHLGLMNYPFWSSNNRVLHANVGVVQIQALLVSVLASTLAILYAVLFEGERVTLEDCMVVFTTSMLTAWMTAMMLAFVTAGIMHLSAQQSIDPDNIAGPLVASLGDLLAIILLALTAVVADYVCRQALGVVVVGMLTFATTFLATAKQLTPLHAPTEQVLTNGWRPLLSGLAISSVAGALLGSGLSSLQGGITALLPLINGVGGNIAGIYASRTASALHKREKRDSTKRTTELTLLALVVPTHSVFLLAARVLGDRIRLFSLPFVVMFFMASLAQVGLLLAIGEQLANRAVRLGLDPDNHVIPYLTAFGDALGTLSLVVIGTIVP